MLIVHRAERTGVLVDALGDLLRVPLTEPFATEVVAVPAKGVERWLTQRLSTVLGAGPDGDGICAGVSFPSPGRLVREVLGAMSGTDPRDEPWDRPVWPLLDVIDASLGEPWCAVLAAHLGQHDEPGGEHRRGRRWATAAHLAELFASYGAARPHMLLDWAAGRDTDGRGPLAPDLLWQAELWRRLRDRLGPSPAERLADDCATLRAEPERCDLPERLSLFGPTRVNTAQLAVLDALAAARDVHLWLPHPGPALWAAVEGQPPGRRRDDRTAASVRHPLLRSLARDVRELQTRLPTHSAVHHPDVPRPATLLGRLQDDLRADRPPGGSGRVPLDESVRLYSCHGAGRQVEVLREVLLGLFQDDPTLEPRDVIVMCPDVETFAPLVGAAFGLGGAAAGADLPHPGHALRVRLADRSLRQTNPLLDTVARLLDLADSRVTASQVLDLASSPAVRLQFGFDDEDLERIRDWAARSGVRWGLDVRTRSAYGLGGVAQNTWRTGLDRLLLGVTTSEDEPVSLGLALPLDDVDSSDIERAGRLAELVDRLDDVLGDLSGEHPVGHWLGTLGLALELLTTTSEADSWQLAQARRELTEVGEGGSSTVRLADVRAMLRDRLRGRPTRANFRTGDLTVCTMVPMRSVPHRVVVLLGLDDGVFPRTSGVDGDDVLARDPCTGERDPRSEDRQLFLDAVLSAGERLVVLHTGSDPVSGAARPPAVPVGELLDVVEAMTGAERDVAVARQPLQPHDARSFTGERPFSFDPVSLAGALRSRQPRTPALPLPRLAAARGPVALEELVAFVEHPVRAYLRQRLRVTLPGDDDEVADALSVGLDGLQEWAVGERLLAAALAGTDLTTASQLEWLRGTLPPGPLGAGVMDTVAGRIGPLVEAGRPLLLAPARSVDVRLDLGDRVLSGTVNGVRDGAVVTVAYSSLSPKHRARAWVLALVVAASGQGDRAVTVGRSGSRARVSTLVAGPDARQVLADLVDLHDRGLREPVPMAAKTSATYALARASGAPEDVALDEAARPWTSSFGGERDDKHHRWVWGERPPLGRLLTDPPDPDEAWPGESTRFGVLARRLWTPLSAAEELS